MLPGPKIIKKCSECFQLIEEHTIMSGNTFGATFWTDGKIDFPMLPDQPSLIKCPHCHALLWIDEQEQVGIIDRWGERDNFIGSQSYDIPSVDDHFTLLEKGNSNTKKEKYLRMRAWWAGNDERRESQVKCPLSDKEIKNLQMLADMLVETNSNDRLLKAEIMRELGRFDNAIDLLAGPFEDELSYFVDNLRVLVQKKDPFVQKYVPLWRQTLEKGRKIYEEQN